MKKSTIIAIGTLAIILIAVGAYGLTRQGATLEDEGRTTETPTGLPNFPLETPESGTQPDSTPDPGQTLTPDSDDPDVISTTQPDPEPTPTPTPTQTPTTYPTPGSRTLTIKTSSGLVEINNVLINPDYKPPLPQDWGVGVRRTPQYNITFFSGAEEAFLISVLALDAYDELTTRVEAGRVARAVAESEFLKVLGISEEDACKLTVTLFVSKDISLDLAGKDYGLSFCPNSILF